MPLEMLEARRLLATYWVDASAGQDSGAGSSTTPFKTITYTLTRATTAGDVVNVRDGTYRSEHAVFAASGTAASPITLQAAPGAAPEVKGSRLVSGWTPDSGAIYKSSWNYYFGSWNSAFTTTPQGSTSGLDARSKARNQFFDNGAILEEVPRKADLKAGSFWIDDPANQVYVWLSSSANPSGHVIEGSDTDQPLLRTDGRDNLVIRGIDFKHNACKPQQESAVRVDRRLGDDANTSNTVLIEDCDFTWMAGAGLSIRGANITMRNVNLTDNAQVGLHATNLTDSAVLGGSWLRNNRHPGKEFDTGWEAGGGKTSESYNMLIDGVAVANNRGSGIWFDVNSYGATVRNCRVYDNMIGIHYEISYAATIANNLVYENRTQGQFVSSPVGLGIYISSSPGCKVLHNTVWGNDSDGIRVAGGDSRTDGLGRPINSYATQVMNNVLSENQVAYEYNKSITLRKSPPNLGNPVIPYSGNTSDYNLFYLPTSQGGGSRKFFRAEDLNQEAATLAQWRTLTGWDTHSVWADPQFVSTATDDFHVQATSPANGIGLLQSAALIDFDGNPRAAGDADAGAYQAGVISSPPPSVLAATLDLSTAQRLVLNFDQGATINSGDVSLNRIDSGVAMPFAFHYNALTHTVTITAGNLADANYRLTLRAAEITNSAGRQLDGNSDGVGGDDFIHDFFILQGDLNRDRKVNSTDFNLLVARFGQSGNFYQGDLNYDGLVNSTDFNLLLARYGSRLLEI